MKFALAFILALSLLSACKKDETFDCTKAYVCIKYEKVGGATFSDCGNNFQIKDYLFSIQNNVFVEVDSGIYYPPVAPDGADYCNFLDTLKQVGDWKITLTKK